MSEPVLLKC